MSNEPTTHQRASSDATAAPVLPAGISSADRYRQLIEGARSVILCMDTAGVMTFANAYAHEFFGYDNGALVGRNVVGTIVPPVDSSGNDLARMIADISADPERYLTNENENMRRNGERVWIAWTNKGIRDPSGAVVEVLCVGNDISKQRQMRTALEQSEEWYRALIELGTTVYTVVAADGTVLYESPSLTRVYGHVPEDLVGRSLLELVHPDDLSYAQQEFAGLLRSPGRPSTVALRYLHKDGSWRIIEAVGVNLLENPVVRGVVLTSHDITDRRRAEDALREREGKIAELEHEVAVLRSEMKGRYEFSNIVGRDPAMRRIFETIRAVSSTLATVLVLGETGTGKELVAKAIHYNSARSGKAFVRVDCGALSESLLESELFGHVRGAFTDAIRDRAGRFELASGGTIFLDEVQNLSTPLQAKLLRVLQDGTFERVGGGGEVLTADARVIVATNADLFALVETGAFRKDLYYRLNVVPITLPTLREKPGDIPLLVGKFVAQFAERHNKPVKGVSGAALELLVRHSWPGNVRELENVIEHAVVLCRTDTVEASDVRIQHAGVVEPAGAAAARFPSPARAANGVAERDLILAALQRSGGNRSKAAALLRMGRTTFYDRLKRHDIPVKPK